MTYKKRLIILLSLIGAMVLAYSLSVIFSYERSSARSSSYVWLDPKSAEKAGRILIDNTNEKFELIKKENKWFVNYYGNEFPARSLRVEDFLSFFTKRAQWPVRSASASAHKRFGLDDNAARITIYGEYSVVLDVLLGDYDNTGSDAYFRKVGQNEVRSGDSSVYSYITGTLTGWYNLRLIPGSADGSVDSSSVQRVTVYNEEETQTFTRKGRAWEISGITVENPDVSAVENYVSFIINAEGEDFADSNLTSGYNFDNSRIVIEFGDAGVTTIRISGPDEFDKRYAKVGGGGLTYVIPLWVTARLFRDSSSFELQ